MKVLLISYEYPPIGGGVGVSIRNFVEATKALREEYDVNMSLLYPGIGGENAIMSFGDRLEHIVIGIKKKHLHHWTASEFFSWFCKTTWQRYLDKRPDVTHFWGAFPAAMMPIRKKPYIVTIHGSDCPGRNAKYDRMYRLLRWSYRRAWRRAAMRTAVTNRLATLGEHFCGKSIHLIPNGVVLPELPKRTECHRPIRLLMCTRIEPAKNIYLAVQIAGAMGEDAVLRICGDGPDFQAYQRCGRKNIEWLGWQTDLDGHYRWADIYLNTAPVTGLNLGMIEAKSYGLPVVTVQFDGARQMRGMYPSGASPSEFSDAIRLVSRLYSHIVERATSDRTRFSWEERGRPYYEAYASVAKESSR